MNYASGEQAIKEMIQCRSKFLFADALGMPIDKFELEFQLTRKIAITTRAGDERLPKRVDEESGLYVQEWGGVF